MNYTTYAQHKNAELHVSTSAELNAAVRQLAGSNGGTIKVDPNGGPYSLGVYGTGSSKAPVLIEPDGGGTPRFTEMTIKNSSFVTVKGMDLDTSGMSGGYRDDLRIQNSSHVEIVDSTFTGSARGYLSEATGSDVRGNFGAYVVDSDNISMEGNTFTNHLYAVRMIDTTDSEFVDNDVTQFQGDGFHGAGLQNMVIEDNHIHAPLGSTQTQAHTDFIQISRASATLQNKDIEIAGNLLDTEGGPGAQGIHVGTGGSSKANEGMSIHDNVIHTSLPRGIGVDGVRDLEIYNNTILLDETSNGVQKTPGADWKAWDPRILVKGPSDAEIRDNIASWIRLNSKHLDDGGYQIQYKNAGAGNHVDKHFNDDLSLKASSPLFGEVGAALSSGGLSVVTRPSTKPDDVTEPEVPPAPEPGAGGSDSSGDSANTDEIRFFLVDSDTDKVVRELSNTDTISSSEVSDGTYNLQAVYDGGAAGSVRFLRGDDLVHTENGAPYAAYKDTKGDFWDEIMPEAGTVHDFEVQVYSGKKGTGAMLDNDTFEFTFVEDNLV